MKLHGAKKQILMAALGFCVAVSVCQGQGSDKWTVIGPGGGGTMIGPTISPHDSRLVVEHCDMTGGYVTHDNGDNWRMFNLYEVINVFAFDPSAPDVIYAGNAAIWRTTDKGQTWKMVFPNPARNTVQHMLGDHADYSVTSDDAAYPGGSATAIAIPAGGKTGQMSASLYAAFADRGTPATVVTSQDGGTTWKVLATLPDKVLQLVKQGPNVIAVTTKAAYQIAANGTVSKKGEIEGGIRNAAVAHAAGAIQIYATGTNGQVYASKDSGTSWKQVTPELGQTRNSFEAIAASDQHAQVAYVGFRDMQMGAGEENQYQGIAKTTDGGRTWKIVYKESTKPAENLTQSWISKRSTKNGVSIFFDSAWSIGVSPTNPEIAYATDLFRTYRTLDGGATWKDLHSHPYGDGSWVSSGLDVTTDYGVQFDPFDPQHVFIDYTDIGLFASTNGGKSWHSSSEGVPEDWRNTAYWLAFDPDQRGLVWGAFSGTHDLPHPKMWRGRSPMTFTGGVGVSTDGGRHWKPSGTGMPSDATTFILLDPKSPVGQRTLYATAYGRGVYKSTDNGNTWTQKNDGITQKEPFAWRLTPSQDDSMYLVVARRSEGRNPAPNGEGALYRTTDKAEHWEPVALPHGVEGPIALEVDPRDAKRLYLAAWGMEGSYADSGGGVYASNDGGKTWEALFTDSQHVYDVTIDPKNPDTLYISGFDAAAYRSTDRGKTWQKINGYDFKWGHRVVLDPHDPTQIYVTTFGGGVWHGPAKGQANRDAESDHSRVPTAH